MTNYRRNSCTYDGSMMGVFLSILFGGVAGVLFFFGFLPTVTFGVIVAAAIAVIALVLFWISIVYRRYSSDNDCICENFGTLLTGIFGTLITAAVVFSLTLVTGTTIFAIIVGLAAFFFALTISGIVSFLNCKADCERECSCNCD